ncbi:MAG: metalloregulator ArsR/SmtB family transcription factor [Gloeomargarita sp. DG02_4_bins_56]
MRSTIHRLVIASMAVMSPAVLTQLADYFKVLSEVSRLQVLCALKDGAKNVTEIMTETGLGQANVSKHLKILTQAGMVRRQPQGVQVYYQISDPTLLPMCEMVCQGLQKRLHAQLQEFR